MIKASNHLGLAILLAVLSSIAPMGIDAYIPSIPDIAVSFSVSIEKIELSLSIFLIGFSIGQIFGGPLSDFYGRKKSSIFGLLGFSFFSFIIIFSSSIYELWLYRFVEAFFGGIVVVNASAAVRDRFKGKEAAKVFSLIGTVRSIAPLLAPAIGAFIIYFFSWKAVFVFLSVYSLIVIFFVSKYLDESYVFVKQDVIESFKKVLSHKKAMKPMLVLSFAFSGFFVLISKSSFIFIEYFNISTNHFPFYFGINFVVLMILTRVNIYLLKTNTPLFIIKIAIIIQIISGFLMALNYQNMTLVQTVLIMATYMGMMAFIFGNCLALALDHFSKNAGVASSVAGVLQFGLGAIISSLVLSFHNETFLPIGISISILSIISFLIIRTYNKA
ncbi:MAG: multidrug effflux MFS transporter [Halarcobacter sp.]